MTKSRVLSALLCVGLCMALISAQAGNAMELSAGAGAIHLPQSTYHYLGYETHLRFGQSERRYVFDLGLAQPLISNGYRQIIGYFAFGLEWETHRDSFFNPYAGLGIGVYDDQVNSQPGIVPSLLMKMGLKLGTSHLGLDLCLTTYLGIYNPSQLLSWVAWPLVNAMGGIYVRF